MNHTNTTPAASGQRHDAQNKPNGQTDADARQLDLLDHGRHAANTRAIAAASSLPKGQSRRDAIERHVAQCGRTGVTRWELHEALSIPYTSVCAPVQALVTSGRLRETKETRLTAYGKPAVVVVSGSLRDEVAS